MRRLLVLVFSLFAAAWGLAGPAQARQGAQPGDFAYYVLSLSWSPSYCAGRPADGQQCGQGRRYGFVLHGLWPQNAPRGWPEFCPPRSSVPQNVVTDMLTIMPSPSLIEHEWEKHGTCSGLGLGAYFDTAKRAFDAIRIPDALRAPGQPVRTTKEGVEDMFARANPGLGPDMISVQCRKQMVSEVRICLDKDLKFRKCEADAGDNCRADSVLFRPVR